MRWPNDRAGHRQARSRRLLVGRRSTEDEHGKTILSLGWSTVKLSCIHFQQINENGFPFQLASSRESCRREPSIAEPGSASRTSESTALRVLPLILQFPVRYQIGFHCPCLRPLRHWCLSRNRCESGRKDNVFCDCSLPRESSLRLARSLELLCEE